MASTIFFCRPREEGAVRSGTMYFHYPTLFKLMRLTFSRQYFSLRHAALVIIFLVPFLLLRMFVWGMRLLDYVFFPGFLKQPLRTPLYIIGNPRSGTTFTHRLLALDEQFSYLKLYQTIFPAVTCYKLFALAGRIDRLLGSPGRRLLNGISKKGFKGWDTIHQTGPEKAESDEMLFMYAMLSPLLGLLFPFLKEMDAATFVDFMPEKSRHKLMSYYKSCLQRHLYATGPDKILLQKVALIAGRLQSIHELLPDMRIVHLVRHPNESIPSLVSMFEATWKSLAPDACKDGRAYRELADLICEYYLHLHEVEKAFPAERLLKVRYEDLVADPRKTVCRIYQEFGLEIRPEYDKLLTEETNKARKYKSKHHYSLENYGLTEEMIYQRLKPVFADYGFKSPSSGTG